MIAFNCNLLTLSVSVIQMTGPIGRTDFNNLEMPHDSAQRANLSKLAPSFIVWGKRQNLF